MDEELESAQNLLDINVRNEISTSEKQKFMWEVEELGLRMNYFLKLILVLLNIYLDISFI